MTAQEQAQEMASEAAFKCSGNVVQNKAVILQTIPLAELLECVEALKRIQNMKAMYQPGIVVSTLNDAKLEADMALASLVAKLTPPA